MTNNLEKRILDKIKKENIKPLPRWFFILKSSIYISFFVISILLGAISFSVLFYIFSDNQSIIFDSYNIYELKNAISFWIILLLSFLGISIWNNKNIKNSYKYQASTIILFNIIISFILGIVLFYTGVAEETDRISSKYLNFYQKNIKITEIKKDIFLNKLKEIGITKEILKAYPELKKKIELKFNEKVLGKTYLDKGSACKKPDFICYNNDMFFEDKNGCGCKKIYK